MKVCFLIPPAKTPEKVPERVYGCTFTYYKQPELPMLYVAAVLEEDSCDVTLKDFTPTKWNEFCDFVQDSAYDIYIFHTVLLAETIDIKAADFILKHTSSSVIFFGPHPTMAPHAFLLNEKCFVARGEAEFIIRDLVRGIDKGTLDGIRGISYLGNNGMTETETYGIVEDLDSIPFPARHLLEDEDSYFNPKLEEGNVTLVLTSRGCSFRCYYCVPNAISWSRELEWKRFHDGKKPPVRLRSPENIVSEFKRIKEQGYGSVSVVDDMFLFGGKKRILDICSGLRDIGMPFGILARCDLILNEAIVSSLAAAGCKYVDLGVESLEQKVLDDIRKDIRVPMVKQSIELLNKHGIEPKANIMFGASNVETKENVYKTIKEISSYPLNYCMFSIATPFPGTEFAEKAKEEGWVVEPEISDLENNLSPTEKSLVSYPNLSKDELEKAVKKANRSFYMNIRRIIFQIRKIKSFKDMKDLILIGWKIIR